MPLRNARLGHSSLTGEGARTSSDWQEFYPSDSWRAANVARTLIFTPFFLISGFPPKWSAPAAGRLRVLFRPSSIWHLTLTSHHPALSSSWKWKLRHIPRPAAVGEAFSQLLAPPLAKDISDMKWIQIHLPKNFFNALVLVACLSCVLNISEFFPEQATWKS